MRTHAKLFRVAFGVLLRWNLHSGSSYGCKTVPAYIIYYSHPPSTKYNVREYCRALFRNQLLVKKVRETWPMAYTLTYFLS